MGFLKWLKPIGKVAAEAGKTAGVTALQTATQHPAVATAIQLANAFSSNEHGITAEQVKVLNVILVPYGFMVIAIPKVVAS